MKLMIDIVGTLLSPNYGAGKPQGAF